MTDILNLEPREVWKHFVDICQVPRPSKREGKIIKFLEDFATAHGLERHTDAAGNVLIRKPATPGFGHLQTVVLQSHMDMVCEKNNDVQHDFDADPIVPYRDGQWVRANGTTLGADDGIGVAAEMAILASTTIKHGPLECLFTVDEETGLTGAFEMQPGFFSGKILINLDSEDEGELFIGCAGGADTVATFDYRTEPTPAAHTAMRIEVKGLLGGHSGDDINKHRGNAVKLLTRMVWEAAQRFGLRLSTMDAGNLRNAIAREGYAVGLLPDAQKQAAMAHLVALRDEIVAEWRDAEPSLSIAVEEVDAPATVLEGQVQHRLLNALYACPHGVMAMSRSLQGLVETSTNLASVKLNGQQAVVTTSQRSSVDSAKADIANMVESVFLLAQADVRHTDGYPGWAPNTDSEILRITRAAYEHLFGVEPVVRAIHAGLECGLFLEKFPELDMISFGPTLRGVHSPDERIDIDTTQRFWRLLLYVLEHIPQRA
ncbi:MAG: aminoacyl-histidine dipeptidase [Bacteroidales bacterium]|nr:aminoacyl-histidine dipeptidase [Bacteroidales bacterium]